jgi:hypothetical protein
MEDAPAASKRKAEEEKTVSCGCGHGLSRSSFHAGIMRAVGGSALHSLGEEGELGGCTIDVMQFSSVPYWHRRGLGTSALHRLHCWGLALLSSACQLLQEVPLRFMGTALGAGRTSA